MATFEWYQRGKKSSDAVEAFTCFWLEFNRFYSSETGNIEFEKIKLFLKNNLSLKSADFILSNHSSAVNYLLSEPVIDMRGNGRNTTQRIAGFYSASDSVEKIQELFAVIYQVRCNLIHGQKSPSVDRDVKLYECCGPIVACMLENTIELSKDIG